MSQGDLDLSRQALEYIRDHEQGAEQATDAALLAILLSYVANKDLARLLLQEVFMDRSIIDESPFLQEWAEGIREKAQQKGLQEGRQVGLQEGRQEGQQVGLQIGQREDILTIWRVRFGEPDATLAEKLKQLNSEQLGSLLAFLVTASFEDAQAHIAAL